MRKPIIEASFFISQILTEFYSYQVECHNKGPTFSSRMRPEDRGYSPDLKGGNFFPLYLKLGALKDPLTVDTLNRRHTSEGGKRRNR